MTNKVDKKNKFKTSKKNNGSYALKTMYYGIIKSPIMIFCYPFMILFEMLYYPYKILVQYINKTKEKINLLLFIKQNKNKKISDFVKPIAIYLPQFHEIQENNEWWGKGFTEWTNVKKAKPLFDGHYQPHIPHEDLGYYDLADVSVMRKQAQMAKEYGIYGFCFYYYHFKDGKRLLEKPIDNYLKATDIDFPFCFAWANANWTRTWDGLEKNVIMPQDYDKDNMILMLEQMMPAFKDKRYIKVNNKPVLLVYRAEIIPEVKKLVKKWRSFINKSGFDDLYLISMQGFNIENPYKMGFDAAAEFAYKSKQNLLFSDSAPLFENIINPFIGTYKGLIEYHLSFLKTPYPRYACVCPSWDNSPRRGANFPSIFVGSSPELFSLFYQNAVGKTLLNKQINKNGFLFINAWNEWGEGAHLEPDLKYGYAYLNTIKNTQQMDVNDTKIIQELKNH